MIGRCAPRLDGRERHEGQATILRPRCNHTNYAVNLDQVREEHCLICQHPLEGEASSEEYRVDDIRGECRCGFWLTTAPSGFFGSNTGAGFIAT